MIINHNNDTNNDNDENGNDKNSSDSCLLLAHKSSYENGLLL